MPAVEVTMTTTWRWMPPMSALQSNVRPGRATNRAGPEQDTLTVMPEVRARSRPICAWAAAITITAVAGLTETDPRAPETSPETVSGCPSSSVVQENLEPTWAGTAAGQCTRGGRTP